jgi:hypothetical protein
VHRGTTDSNPTILLHVASAMLQSTENGEPLGNPPANRAVVGSLCILAEATHPVIANNVGVLRRPLLSTAVMHMLATKNFVGFPQGNRNTGHAFPRSDDIRIEGHTDSDYANCTDTKASISDKLVTIKGGPVRWYSSRLATCTHSSTAAEYY